MIMIFNTLIVENIASNSKLLALIGTNNTSTCSYIGIHKEKNLFPLTVISL